MIAFAKYQFKPTFPNGPTSNRTVRNLEILFSDKAHRTTSSSSLANDLHTEISAPPQSDQCHGAGSDNEESGTAKHMETRILALIGVAELLCGTVLLVAGVAGLLAARGITRWPALV
ncbi:MAG TPA: hypothetical protein VF670_06670 [Duganella sp.]